MIIERETRWPALPVSRHMVALANPTFPDWAGKRHTAWSFYRSSTSIVLWDATDTDVNERELEAELRHGSAACAGIMRRRELILRTHTEWGSWHMHAHTEDLGGRSDMVAAAPRRRRTAHRPTPTAAALGPHRRRLLPQLLAHRRRTRRADLVRERHDQQRRTTLATPIGRFAGRREAEHHPCWSCRKPAAGSLPRCTTRLPLTARARCAREPRSGNAIPTVHFGLVIAPVLNGRRTHGAATGPVRTDPGPLRGIGQRAAVGEHAAAAAGEGYRMAVDGEVLAVERGRGRVIQAAAFGI